MEMRSVAPMAALVGIALACAAGAAQAQAKPQSRIDLGELEYRSSCALCHGPQGKGDGEYRMWLTKRPTDLTTLAKANGGVFPIQRVYEIIDGRQMLPAHGIRGMPIWGARYIEEETRFCSYAYVPGADCETIARTRILTVMDYLNRLQVK